MYGRFARSLRACHGEGRRGYQVTHIRDADDVPKRHLVLGQIGREWASLRVIPILFEERSTNTLGDTAMDHPQHNTWVEPRPAIIDDCIIQDRHGARRPVDFDAGAVK